MGGWFNSRQPDQMAPSRSISIHQHVTISDLRKEVFGLLFERSACLTRGVDLMELSKQVEVLLRLWCAEAAARRTWRIDADYPIGLSDSNRRTARAGYYTGPTLKKTVRGFSSSSILENVHRDEQRRLSREAFATWFFHHFPGRVVRTRFLRRGPRWTPENRPSIDTSKPATTE